MRSSPHNIDNHQFITDEAMAVRQHCLRGDDAEDEARKEGCL